jgi:hypothetical protein
VRVLHLDVGVVLAEDLDEPVEVGGGVGRALFSRALQTRPERQPESAMSPCEWLWSSSQSTRGL